MSIDLAAVLPGDTVIYKKTTGIWTEIPGGKTYNTFAEKTFLVGHIENGMVYTPGHQHGVHCLQLTAHTPAGQLERLLGEE